MWPSAWKAWEPQSLKVESPTLNSICCINDENDYNVFNSRVFDYQIDLLYVYKTYWNKNKS